MCKFSTKVVAKIENIKIEEEKSGQKGRSYNTENRMKKQKLWSAAEDEQLVQLKRMNLS